MKCPAAAYLLLGLCLSHCAPAVPGQAPSPVGRWEQLGVRTVTHDLAGHLLDDEYEANEPGRFWLELTAAGTVYFRDQGLAQPTATTYAYRADTLRFRDEARGETRHPVLVLGPHRLVYRSHEEASSGTEDRTYTYRR